MNNRVCILAFHGSDSLVSLPIHDRPMTHPAYTIAHAISVKFSGSIKSSDDQLMTPCSNLLNMNNVMAGFQLPGEELSN
jgi:hypothetical protein